MGFCALSGNLKPSLHLFFGILAGVCDNVRTAHLQRASCLAFSLSVLSAPPLDIIYASTFPISFPTLLIMLRLTLDRGIERGPLCPSAMLGEPFSSLVLSCPALLTPTPIQRHGGSLSAIPQCPGQPDSVIKLPRRSAFMLPGRMLPC